MHRSTNMSTYDNLDIRSLKIRDRQELMMEITNMVKDTQRYIVRELPNTITMTRKQFNILDGDAAMLGTTNDNSEHLFRTPHNVMEVIIKE